MRGRPGGAGKHRADPSRSPSDGRASRDGGNARTDKPLGGDYTVRPGDNLSVIAQEHSVEGGWSSLYQKNEKKWSEPIRTLSSLVSALNSTSSAA
ncbi:hypothetical protein GCM10020000_48500 [Streptomyces olivoverticillatus]